MNSSSYSISFPRLRCPSPLCCVREESRWIPVVLRLHCFALLLTKFLRLITQLLPLVPFDLTLVCLTDLHIVIKTDRYDVASQGFIRDRSSSHLRFTVPTKDKTVRCAVRFLSCAPTSCPCFHIFLPNARVTTQKKCSVCGITAREK